MSSTTVLVGLAYGLSVLALVWVAAAVGLIRDHRRRNRFTHNRPCAETINLRSLGGRKQCRHRGFHLVHEAEGVRWASERRHLVNEAPQ